MGAPFDRPRESTPAQDGPAHAKFALMMRGGFYSNYRGTAADDDDVHSYIDEGCERERKGGTQALRR